MRRFAGYVALLLAACGAETPDPTSPAGLADGGPALAKPVAAIPLVVTVTGTGIQSDGLGDYVDGEQTVLAQIDANGNFRLNADAVAGGRTLVLDFSAQATGASYTVNTAGMTGFQILTQQNTTPAPGRIDNLLVGVATCYPLSLGFRDATTHHRALYHSTQENNAGTQSEYVTVTRIDADTWTLVSGGICPGTPNWAGVWSQDLSTRKAGPLVFRGYWDLPVAISFRRK